MRKKKLKKQSNQSEEFNLKESRCDNVLVLMNQHQDMEKMLSSVDRSVNIHRCSNDTL